MNVLNLSYQKILRPACQHLTALSGVAIALSYSTLPVLAAPLQPSAAPMQLAQVSIIGECRTTNAAIGMFPTADTTGTRVASLDRGAIVRLADGGSKGWIKIDFPKAGFIQAASLVKATCPPDLVVAKPPTPPPANPAELCRKVIAPPAGLIVRAEPATTAKAVGPGVGFGDKVTLTTKPATTKQDSTGRFWVQISAPDAGWVSNGYAGASNLGLCP